MGGNHISFAWHHVVVALAAGAKDVTAVTLSNGKILSLRIPRHEFIKLWETALSG